MRKIILFFAFLSLVLGVGATLPGGSFAGVSAPLGDNAIVYKKLTKAQCLKKRGYVWIADGKRCVKASRGSD